MMRTLPWAFVLTVLPTLARGADEGPLPKPADGWSIERVIQAPKILYPTAIVASPDGTIFLGQDPMDMPGPPTVPSDSVVSIRGAEVRVFADRLWSVMGLEWLDGTLFVVHAPFLSAFRDTDGDGRADQRVDLVTGLGPKLPGFNGLNDHVASGIRLGMDGFLYVAVGDKGIPKGVGRDGSTITMSTGGVIRVRPDGTGLEVVSTGERNPLSVALTAGDDVFTLGNDDDSKKWPNSLTHHVVGGHFGYPYEFLTAPYRALPIVAGYFGGAGAQGICYNEDGLPARYRGNLIFCDWGLQTVFLFEVEKAGGTFKVVRREPLVTRGDLADFRPFSLAVSPGGSSLLLVDWAFNGWLASGPKTGRLFRLTYTGSDRAEPSPLAASSIEGLGHPALARRLEAQRALASEKAVGPLVERLGRKDGPTGRIHALWALDAIGTPEARRAIRSGMEAIDGPVRLQAARSSGIRRDREARPALAGLLRDPDPAIRREAAIALGRLGESSAGLPLHAALGDADPFAAWSVRTAIRALGAWDAADLGKALADPARRENALKLADESWAIPAVRALAEAQALATEPGWKARVVAAVAGQYHRYPEWSGHWFGTDPLAGSMPRKTRDWTPEGMDAVLTSLARALRDPDPGVRRQALIGLIGVGPRAAPLLRVALATEADPVNAQAMAQTLGSQKDFQAVPVLARLLGDGGRPVEVRASALDALASLPGPAALNARLLLVYDATAPDALVGRALPALGQARVLPANDLAGFLDHKAGVVRAAALGSFPTDRPLPAGVRQSFLDRLEDPAPEVQTAAIRAVAAAKIREAIPRLLALAGEGPSRLEATRALAAMPDARAVPAYVAALKDRDPETRRAGELALVVLRDVVAGDLADRAKHGQFVGPAALAVERVLTRFVPVTDWRVIGPFPRTTAASFETTKAIDFARLLIGAEGRPVAWQIRKGDPTTGRVSLEDLKGGTGDRGGFGFDASGSPDLAAFAYAEVTSDRDRSALMMVGSSGSILVTVNDRPLAPDSDLIRFPLKAGINRILVRSRQGLGAWSFSVQVSEPSTNAMVAEPGSIAREGLRTFALTHTGAPKTGEALFRDSQGLNCVRCHAGAGQGTGVGVGPDLTGLASKYDKAEIIRSVLEPTARIATGYQPLVIARTDGTVLTGIFRGETDLYIDLIDAEGRPIRVPKAAIERRKVGEVSLMPSGLADGLSPIEFADLIAYLTSLKAGR